MSYPRLSAAERRRLASSERAKKAGLGAALSMGVRLGAGPGSGAPAPAAGDYYNISAPDRAVFEAAIYDTQSSSYNRAQGARSALRSAFKYLIPVILGYALSGMATLVIDFAGRRFNANLIKRTGGGLSAFGYGSDRGLNLAWTAQLSWNITSAAGTPQGNATAQFTRSVIRWDKTIGGSTELWSASPPPILRIPSVQDFYGWDGLTNIPYPHNGPPPPYALTVTESVGPVNIPSIVELYVCDRGPQFAPNEQNCRFISNLCGTVGCQDSFEADDYDLGPMENPPPAATTDVVIDRPTTQAIIDDLKKSPWYGQYPPNTMPPDLGTLPDPVFDPGTGTYPGLGPLDPFDPGAGPEPGDYYDPGPGPGLGTFDPTRETCIMFRELPVGFNDPTQPGGIAARYQPGQRATISTGGTEKTDDAVPQSDISASCYSALQAAGWRVAGTRIVPLYDFIRRDAVTDQVWNCLILAGWKLREGTTDVSVVADTALYRPGAPDVYSGKIRSVTRLPEGGVRICFESPLQDRPIVEKLCWRGKVQDAIRDVLGQMGVENVIFDSGCTAVIFPRVCFPAATPLKQILEYFLDICGFCVFPQFDGNVIVGFCQALNVHWHYHEDVDLIGFDSEYSNTDIPSIVEAFRPDQINRAGKIIAEGYAYPVAVQSAVGTGGDLMRVEVPLNTTNAQVESIARSQARKLAMQAVPLVGFAVPLNSQIQLRHQIHIQRPSLGFAGVYMVTRLAREYSEDAFLTLGTGRWLRGET